MATTRMSNFQGMISFTSAYRSLLFMIAAMHAAPFAVALTTDGGVKETPASVVDSVVDVCANDIREDAWDVVREVLMMVTVFCLGWLMSRSGIFYISMQGRTHKSAKVVEFETPADSFETSATYSSGPACAKNDCAVAGALPNEQKVKDVDSTTPTAPASPTSTTATTAPVSPDRAGEPPPDIDMDFLFDVVDGFGLEADDSEGRFVYGHDDADASSMDIAAAEAKICDCASWHDLASCWQTLQAAQAHASLSEATCFVLATAVRHAATAPADAENALEVALASNSEHLSEAALAAGAKVCGAAWLARAGGRLYAAGMPRRASHAVDLARAHGREHRADLACDLWREHRAEACGAEPAAPKLYAAALEACVGSGDFESALRLVQSAQAGDSDLWFSPPTKSGQAALLGLARWLAKRQDLAAAQRCVAAVRAAGGAPDLRTFHALLRSCARSFNMDKAEAIYNDLLASGLAPDFTSLSAMVQGLCAVGHIEKGLQYFRDMRRRGFTPDSALFDAILDGCARRSAHALMEGVLADMEELSVRPSNATLVVLVRYLGGQGMLDKALETFEEMSRKHNIEVNAPAYCALIDACLSNGRLSLALETFDRLARDGGQATTRTYEALITGCLRSGELERAVALVDHALGLEREGAAAPIRRALLEASVLDGALRLIGKRRRAGDLGAPLLARLQAAGISVSEDVAAATLRAAKQVASVPVAAQQRRLADFQRWRDFAHSQ